ncbi:MAG: PAS domain-containing protein [Terriglobales bacterium]
MTVRRKILFLNCGESVSATRKLVLEHAGYRVTSVLKSDDAIEALQKTDSFQAVLIGARAKAHEAENVVRTAQKCNVPTVLISNRYGAKADVVLPSMVRPERLLEVVGEAVIRQHGHDVPDRGCFLFVDSDRRYIHVTTGAADMLGFERTELIGRRIDDISSPEMPVASKFQEYVRDGLQCGSYTLLRRDGTPVRITYQAQVLSDGCMVSEISPDGQP